MSECSRRLFKPSLRGGEVVDDSPRVTGPSARRPAEAAICEGNLIENPIFVLHSSEAKPKDKSEYVKLIPLGTIIDGKRAIERAIKLHASTEFGFPTTFAYRLILIIIALLQETGFANPTIRTTRYHLAKRLGIKRPSRKDYEDIENACNALAAMFIQFRGTWYSKGGMGRWQDRDGVHLLERVKFQDERTESGTEKETGSITVGCALLESLRAGYYNGIDIEYLNALKRSPLAQLLYGYLTKKDQEKRTFTIGLKELAMRFNLKRRTPSALFKHFGDAAELLTQPILIEQGKSPRRFLEMWFIDRQKLQLTVTFFRPTECLHANEDRQQEVSWARRGNWALGVANRSWASFTGGTLPLRLHASAAPMNPPVR